MRSTAPGGFAIAANGFADGPAQALRQYLVDRGFGVFVIGHPLSAEEGKSHVVEAYANGSLVSTRSMRTPLRPPHSFLLDPFIPLRLPRVEAWFGFNPLACARGLLARRQGRTRVTVLWSVDFVPDRFGRGTLGTRLYDRLDKICCIKADARVELTATARDARAARHDLSAATTPTHVVPMGAWLDRAPVTQPDAYKARRIVLLAHLVRRQGVDVVLEALSVLRGRGVEATAEIVGTGPLESRLQEQAMECGIGDLVRFHGFVPDHREVERILASASVAVAPYRPGEGTFTPYADPGKLKAYLAAGLPILLTNVPPNAVELSVDGGAELVPFDAEAIADAVARLLDTPETWRERRAAALNYARRFDWPVLFDELLGRLGINALAG
jgi:glycosyltransferase involved in cell wall biosynthesis